MDKKASRLRRATRARKKIQELGATRLVVHRTPRHIYAQVIAANGSEVLVSASTVEKSVSEQLSGYTGNLEAAKVVGKIVAERAKEKGVEQVAFDRSGFQYHGRVAALADAAREAGLQF
jgi:large subunit ribosomal protein L18